MSVSLQSQTLPRLPEEPSETAFDALRADGIRRAQALSGERWSDYNLHDPGVTLLEAACYALTELAYRADFPVADHLADEQGRVDWALHGLHPPVQAFPCRSATPDDLRRALLEAVRTPEGLPALDGVTARHDPRRPGVLELLLDPVQELDAAGERALKLQVRREAAALRNLGEDLDEVRLLQSRRCRLHATLSIGGAREPADIVAEVYERCEAYLAAAALAQDEAGAQALTPAQWFEGPLTRHGRVSQQRLDRASASTLFIADLVACVREVEGVVDVAGLALEPEGGEPVSTAMPWRDARAGWTLTLAPPDSPWALEHLQVQWRGQELPGVLPALMRWLVERRATRRAREHEVAVAHEALPGGRFLEPLPHYPLQSHLPPAYAMDELGRATADGPGLLHARQLQGYLALLDQLVAHGSAQLAHLGGLFRHDAGTAPSYRWHVLGGKDVPGLQALLEDTPGAIEQAVCQPLDDAIERRSRMLDVLLALHGQTYAQNALRQSSDHLSPREREHALLLNKQAFAADVVRLQRDRAGGFDWSRPSWNVPDNVSGLQRRVALLLGFGHEGSRTLVSGLRPGLDWCEPDAAGAPRRVPLPAGWQPLDLEAEPPAPSGGPGTFEAALARLPAGLGGAARGDVPLPAPLLHCAARHDRYLVAPRTRQGDRSLLLGPDANGAYWLLAELGWKELARDADLAPRLARRVRQQALARDREAEGLHVVEHLLLRPLAGRPHPDVPAAFHDLQVSVVFPDWTLRCHRPAFRLLAEETVNINLPAHLTAHCLWLGPAAMREFEDAYETWLRARLHWAQMPEDLYRRRALDAWSATLAGKLLGWLRAQTDFDRLASADEAWPAPDDGDDAAG